jgi:hypothetical protein
MVSPLLVSAHVPPESNETGSRGVFSRRIVFAMISLCVVIKPLFPGRFLAAVKPSARLRL